MSGTTSSTQHTLRVLELTEANLAKVEHLWKEIQQRIPDGIVFGGEAGYDDLRRRYSDIVAALPLIDGFRFED